MVLGLWWRGLRWRLGDSCIQFSIRRCILLGFLAVFWAFWLYSDGTPEGLQPSFPLARWGCPRNSSKAARSLFCYMPRLDDGVGSLDQANITYYM